jgi:mono/diheme cytochrome c family protein
MRVRLLPVLLLVVWCLAPGYADAQNVAQPDHSVVIGFDRLYANTKDATLPGGKLLLAELNCISCHQPAADAGFAKKQAPILDGVGGRVGASYLRAFLNDPQAAKPGTTMPNLLAALSPQDREEKLESLVHFLASTGNFIETPPVPKSIAKGKKLFHEIGCAACHGPYEAKLKDEAHVAPLGDLSKKYSIVSLTLFLQDPHKIRPAGRMPSLNLKYGDAQDLANYLLNKLKVADAGGNLKYAYYESPKNLSKLPDFTMLKPVVSGLANGFDLDKALRNKNVAMKFDGVLAIPTEANYTFHLTSDDGSKFWIQNQLVIDHDGTHSADTKSGSMKLAQGKVPFTVAVFNQDGDFELKVEMEGPTFRRQALTRFLVPIEEKEQKMAEAGDSFTVNPALAKKGRELFANLGCASCHDLKDGKTNIVSAFNAPDLSKLNSPKGCLGEPSSKRDAAHPAPVYALTASQRAALLTALKSPGPAPKLAPKEIIAQTFATFNCYACHQRDGNGGVENGLNEFFATTQKEMGDEGRLPPHLNGVGGKLTAAHLTKVLAGGVMDRPYMLTRMPKFAAANVGHLQAVFEIADPVPTVPVPTFHVSDKTVKSQGRQMVGNEMFGCVKCHDFRDFKSEGVRGINMATMTERLRREWFTQYLLDPNKFRPGTRMPSAWPQGQSMLPKVLEGDTAQQIEAVWRYLSDGTSAALPTGLGKTKLPLIAKDTPLIYRNFIEGAGTRAIGVGYPEKINLAFDANDLRYAMLWHMEFIDASKHWTGRGEGSQPPLGESILRAPPGPAFALLQNEKEAWPAKALKEKGYQFKGYRFDEKLRPTFLYNLGAVHVEDFMLPVEDKSGPHFLRTLTITAEKALEYLWFRAAAEAKIIDAGKGWYSLGNDLRIRLETDATPVLRTQGGKMELLVPVRGKQVKIVQEIVW